MERSEKIVVEKKVIKKKRSEESLMFIRYLNKDLTTEINELKAEE